MNLLAKRLAVLASLVCLALLVPWLAMQFTDDVMWSLADFIAAAILLFGAGFTYLAIIQVAPKQRFVFASGGLVVLVLVWAELAVGIFSSPWAGT